MSTVYVRDVEDERGVIDREFFCDSCRPADLMPWPCYEATDSPECCRECGYPVGNDLTDEGMARLEEMIFDGGQFAAWLLEVYGETFRARARDIDAVLDEDGSLAGKLASIYLGGKERYFQLIGVLEVGADGRLGLARSVLWSGQERMVYRLDGQLALGDIEVWD